MDHPQERSWVITQSFPAQGLEKQTITVTENGVSVKHKNIFQEWSYEYSYAELKSKVVRGRTGDSTWSNIGWWLIGIGGFGPLILSFAAPKLLPSNYLQIVASGLLILGVIAFMMRFVKQDQVWFYEKDNSFGFGITLYNNDRADREEAIAFIIKKIELAGLRAAVR